MENQEQSPLIEQGGNQQPDFINQQTSTGNQVPLPNASTVMVLGIISIVGCCCYGIVGIICGIIALVLAKNAKALYEANPSAYTESSFKNLNTGRICAIIGLVLSALYIFIYIIFIIIYGAAILTDPQLLMNSMGA